MCKPFVKWVGGKTQLLSEIREKYPINCKKYCEPFVGGGAVLFDVIENTNIDIVMINDINKALVNTYSDIKENINVLIKKLKSIENHYNNISEEDREINYYKYRDKYNDLIKNDDIGIDTSVLFIFLNKTCFNGLYRVNSKGEYNVPKGRYIKPMICDTNNLIEVSKTLQNVIIKCGDYNNCLDFIDRDTFVYIDPPYRPLNKTSAFTSYNNNNFDDSEQIRLKEFIDNINEKECKMLLSNSDPLNEDPDDDFFDKLYSNYKVCRVNAKRCINSNGNKRGNISELLISNY